MAAAAAAVQRGVIALLLALVLAAPGGRAAPAMGGPAAGCAEEGDCSSLLQLDQVRHARRVGAGGDAAAPGRGAPSVFVGMMSRRSAWDQRAELRGTSRGLTLDHIARFVLCGKPEPGQDATLEQEQLLEEQRKFGDLLFLDCFEGYERLNEKTAVMLERFDRDFRDKDYFIKVDDDCFVAWRRLERVLRAHSGESIYLGKRTDHDEVIRDPNSPWYQPADVYPNATFPRTMAGAFYALSSDVVHGIVQDRVIDHKHLLIGEDRAVGLWVYDLIHRAGVPVSYVEVPGFLGYTAKYLEAMGMTVTGPVNPGPSLEGTWSSYPLTLHHRLQAATIHCLAELDARDDGDAQIAPCFALQGDT